MAIMGKGVLENMMIFCVMSHLFNEALKKKYRQIYIHLNHAIIKLPI